MLKVRNVSIAFDDTQVLHHVDLDVAHGEIICLLGESGSGKTTLLRVIAGLESDYEGKLLFDGLPLDTVPVHRRGFGLMFQDFALFPHLNVADNVAFGLRIQGIDGAERERRVHDALALVGLDNFAQRDVAMLSGGEKQRVALARSLAPRPRLLMLDEPLGSLDAALRERLVLELRDIIKNVGLTAIYVTHDQEEAYAIADRIAVMNVGRIEQFDAPATLYRNPQTVFVARFLGLENIITVDRWHDGMADTSLGAFPIPTACDAILLHPDGLSLDPSGRVRGVLETRVFRGDHYRLRVALEGGNYLTLRAPTIRSDIPDSGEIVTVAIDAAQIIALRH